MGERTQDLLASEVIQYAVDSVVGPQVGQLASNLAAATEITVPMNRRRFFRLTAGVATAAVVGGALATTTLETSSAQAARSPEFLQVVSGDKLTDLSYLTPNQVEAATHQEPLTRSLGLPTDPTPYEFFNQWYMELPTSPISGDPMNSSLRVLEVVQGKVNTPEGYDRAVAFQQAVANYIYGNKGIALNLDFANAKLIFPNDSKEPLKISRITDQVLRDQGVREEDIYDGQFGYNENGQVSQLNNEWQTAHRPTAATIRSAMYSAVTSQERGDIIVVETDQENDEFGPSINVKYDPGAASRVAERSANLPVTMVKIPAVFADPNADPNLLGYDVVLISDDSCFNKIFVGLVPKPKPPVTEVTPTPVIEQVMFCKNGQFLTVTPEAWRQQFLPELAKVSGTTVEELQKLSVEEQLRMYSSASCQTFPTPTPTSPTLATPSATPTPGETPSVTTSHGGGGSETTPNVVATAPPPTQQPPTSVPTVPAETATPRPADTPRPVVTAPPPTQQPPTSVPTVPAETATPRPADTPRPVVTAPPPTQQPPASVPTKAPVVATPPPPKL